MRKHMSCKHCDDRCRKILHRETLYCIWRSTFWGSISLANIVRTGVVKMWKDITQRNTIYEEAHYVERETQCRRYYTEKHTIIKKHNRRKHMSCKRSNSIRCCQDVERETLYIWKILHRETQYWRSTLWGSIWRNFFKTVCDSSSLSLFLSNGVLLTKILWNAIKSKSNSMQFWIT